MSRTYHIYAEVRYKGQWYNLNPMMMNSKGEYDLRPVYWGGSEMWDAYCELEDDVWIRGIPEDMCQELRNCFHNNLDENLNGWPKDYTYRKYYSSSMFAVRLDRGFTRRIVKDRPYKYRGYIYRHTLAAFESGEMEDINNWITIDEYKQLSDKEKDEYVFYEWNNSYDNYGIYTAVVARIRHLLSWFIDSNRVGNRYTVWDDIGDSDIRVYIYQF